MNSLRILRDCLPEGIDPNEVTSETTFQSLGMDSLDYVTFLANAQEAFDVDIPNSAAKEFRSLGDVERWLITASV